MTRVGQRSSRTLDTLRNGKEQLDFPTYDTATESTDKEGAYRQPAGGFRRPDPGQDTGLFKVVCAARDGAYQS